MSYKQIILSHLKEKGTWVRGYDLEKVHTNYGWLGSSGSRRARELFEAEMVERQESEEGYAEYRSKQPLQAPIIQTRPPDPCYPYKCRCEAKVEVNTLF